MKRIEDLRELAQDVMGSVVKAKFLELEVVTWNLENVFDLVVDEARLVKKQMSGSVEEDIEEVVGEE
jgi:hypothetical protein